MNKEQSEVPENSVRDRAQALSDAAFEAVFISDDGLCIDVNQAALDMFGYSRDELLGIHMTDVVSEAFRDLVKNNIQTQVEGAYQATCQRKDGSTFFAELRGKMFQSQGHTYRATMIRNIVEHVETLRQLDESRLRYDLAIKGTNDGIWDWCRETDSVYFSPRWKEIIGYEDHEFQNHLDEWKRRIHPADYNRVMDANDIFFHDPEAENFSVEYRLMHKDGDYRWVLGRGTCMRDEEGVPFRMAGAHTDITATKLAEEALRHSENRWQDILMHTPQIGVSFNAEGEITFANAYFCSLTGWDRGGVLGTNWFDTFIPEGNRSKIRSFFKAIFDKRTSVESSNREIPIVCRNGELRHVAWSNVLSRDSRGKFVEITCLGVDLTEQQRMTAALERAKEYAESANKAKSVFLATMSHEIRTPLNGIMGMLQLALTTKLDHEGEEYIATALTSSKDLLRILSDVLDLTRIEAGMFDISESEFSVGSMILPVVNSLEELARRKDLSLEYSVQPNVPKLLRGDVGRIRQVLVNLVNNAIKYTRSGGVYLTFSGNQSSVEGTFNVLIQIADTGIGIPMDKLNDIWEPFGKVDKTITETHTGIGLGLSIVRKLVDSMGGRVLIDSQVDVGTTVSVMLPLTVISEEEFIAGSTGVELPGTDKLSCRVLLVEDDPLNQVALKTMLEKSNVTVELASNGMEALQLIDDYVFDLVFMDVQMPVMNGLEATREIIERVTPATRPPIIAMTAFAMSGDRDNFLAAGMDDYMSKPIEFDDISRMLAKYLGTGEE